MKGEFKPGDRVWVAGEVMSEDDDFRSMIRIDFDGNGDLLFSDDHPIIRRHLAPAGSEDARALRAKLVEVGMRHMLGRGGPEEFADAVLAVLRSAGAA